jgi:hypothetical protein
MRSSMLDSLQCQSPAWEQAGPLFFVGQALAWISGPFRPHWPLSEHALVSLREQALAWLSGPFRPRWPLPEQALVSLREQALESLPEQALQLPREHALQSLRWQARPLYYVGPALA